MTDPAWGKMPTWPEVQERLQLHEPHPISVSEDPHVLVLIEPADRALGLVAAGWPFENERTVRPAKGIRIQPHGPGGEAAIWIEDPELLELGWSFLAAVGLRLLAGETLFGALESELERWRDLVATLGTTSVAAAIGALGELAIFRAALLAGRDPSCWVGLDGGAIDFRFGVVECEVKTTSGTRHEHIINGADQLRPSVGCRLLILSLVIAPTELGSGSSVVQLVSELVALGAKPEPLERSLLVRRGVRLGDPATHAGYVLRTTPLVIAVDENFPALTSTVLGAALGPNAARIRDVTYRIDLEGLPSASEPDVHLIAAGVAL